MAGAAPRLTVSGSRCFYCCWFCLVSTFVFDVAPVIPCALLCQAWPLHPVLPSTGLGLTAWCQLPTAGARSQLQGWCLHPLPMGTEAAARGSEWQPGAQSGSQRLRVGTTALAPHNDPVLRSQCHHSLYWEEPALRHKGVAVEILFMILCCIVLFILQISLIPAVLSARMARRRWVLCVRLGGCCTCHLSLGGHSGCCGCSPTCGGCQDGVRKCPGCISANCNRGEVKKGTQICMCSCECFSLIRGRRGGLFVPAAFGVR